MTAAKQTAPIVPRLSKRAERKDKSLNPILHCSFCGKNQHEIEKLVAGPAVFICNECVAKCNEFIAMPIDAPRPDSQIRSIWDLEALPTERLIHWLKVEAALYEHTGSGLVRTVDVLRKREISWAVIGEALGISRQAAWDRFS